MRYVLTAAAALVLGLLLGVLPSRLGTRSLEEQIAELEARPCEQRRVGEELATMFAGRPPLRPTPGDATIPEPTPEEAATDESTEDMPDEAPDESMDLPSEDQIALAQEALDLRRTQAREALIQEAGVDDEQLAAIDDAYAAMNRALEEKANQVVELIGEGAEEPSRREMMLFAEDLLGIMNQAEEDVLAELDSDQLEALEDSTIDPFSHVDPGILDLFAELDP